MSFCSNCGKEITDGAKFCSGCGAPIDGISPNKGKRGDGVFSGDVYKCPNCGEMLNTFDSTCPKCGMEIRGVKASHAIEELAEKITKAKTNKDRIFLLKNYPIPNTKEDIFEFFIMATSNFDIVQYERYYGDEDLSDAWLSKINQCYQKAELLFGDSPDFIKIKELYEKTMSEVEEVRRRKDKHYKRIESPEEIAKKEKKKEKDNKKFFIAMISLVAVLIISFAILFIMEAVSIDPNSIEIGFDHKDFEDQHYEDIIQILENKGFTNIEAREDGWHLLHKSGAIKSVTIDGDDDYRSTSRFSKDALIIILYYK